MLKSRNSIGLAAAILFAGALSASANVTVLDYSVQNGAGNQADVFASDYGAFTPIGATWSEDPTVPVPPVANVSTNQYKSPFVDTSVANTRSYFSTGGVIGTAGSVSPITLTFDVVQDSISLLWGSIDSYNTISFLDTFDAVIDSFTGSQIIAAINTQLSAGISTPQTNYEIVALLKFDLQEDFKKIIFSSESNGVGPSDQAAFEFALAPIPLPAAAWLLLAGIGGLFGYGRFRRQSSTATA